MMFGVNNLSLHLQEVSFKCFMCITPSYADATVVSNPAEGCESHHYRAADGRVSAEVICGAKRFAATGRWSILGSGLDCTVWDNDWVGGCVSWRHLGDGRVAFERTSGEVKPSSGESQVYEGNVFGL